MMAMMIPISLNHQVESGSHVVFTPAFMFGVQQHVLDEIYGGAEGIPTIGEEGIRCKDWYLHQNYRDNIWYIDMPYYDNYNLLESYFFLCNRDDGRLTRGRPRHHPVLHEPGRVSLLLLLLLLFPIWTLSPPPPPCLCSQNVFSDVLWNVPYLSPKIAPRYSKEEGWPPPGIVALSIGKSMQVRLRTICRSDGTITFHEWSPDFFALDKAPQGLSLWQSTGTLAYHYSSAA